MKRFCTRTFHTQAHLVDRTPLKVLLFSIDLFYAFSRLTIIMLMVICSLTLCHSATAQGTKAQTSKVINIGSQRQLFLDDLLVEKMIGKTEFRMHHPVPQEIVLTHDAPWEGSYSNYNSIFRDGELYRMYYRGWQKGPEGETVHPMVWCYAESEDGIHWKKPNLGLFEFNGSKENNIVLASTNFGNFKYTLTDNVSVFKDHNPAAPPDAKYKALVYVKSPQTSLLAFKSSDAINWKPLQQAPILVDSNFDTQNTAFWDSENKEYRVYWRMKYFLNGVKTRGIRTASSKDFLTWKERANISYEDTFHYQMYTNGVLPYYRAPQLYIGLPAVYVDRGWTESMRSLPEVGERQKRGRTNPRYSTALTESLLMSSRDGVNFKRWEEAFLRPGIERNGSWSYGHQYIGWSIVETKSALEGAPNELSLYANESLWTGTSSVLRRYTLRLDGFVSIKAPYSGGGFLTKPLKFDGELLALNFSTAARGSIRVEIQDLNGKPLRGFALDDCEPIYGDTVDRIVHWKATRKVISAVGKEVRLYFEMKDADLYSFRFGDTK